jgi:hypothetical protein
LIEYGHWGICPSCEPAFWATIAHLYEQQVKPVLFDKGIPARR